jgi:hypothetical protein
MVSPYTDEPLYGRRSTLNPDCRDGKHRACRGDAWDDIRDTATLCTCGCHDDNKEVK